MINILKASPLKDIIKRWKRFVPLPSINYSNNEDLPSYTSLKSEMDVCIEPHLDDITSRNRIINLGSTYSTLSSQGKTTFFEVLLQEFAPSHDKIEKILHNYPSTNENGLFYEQQNIISILTPPRIQILKKFVSLENGLYFLVKMREDVLNLMKEKPNIKPIAIDIFSILSPWFDIAMLDMKQITWDSPASLLEKLIIYEAVHKIQSWNDLRNRLDSDRKCFGFFHNKMPLEPLVFVEVALTNKTSTSIQEILNEDLPNEDPNNATTAVFYSISNTQKGLRGISLGNFLIKTVVSNISTKYKNINTFVTLSPLPNFVSWLKTLSQEQIQSILPKKLLKTMKNIPHDFAESLQLFIAKNLPESVIENMKSILLSLAAYYIIKEKNKNNKLKAFDPVANFHISNGANVLQFNWLADTSSKGMSQSAGIMVNYHYQPNEIESNYVSYVSSGLIPYSKNINKLLKMC